MKMKRILSMMLVLVMIALCVSACGEKGPELEPIEVTAGTPSYADDKQIELSAYCGPRRAGYRYWNGVYGEHPEDPAGGWDGWITEEAFRDYLDCGFTYVLSEYDALYDYDYDKQTSVTDFEDSDLYEYMEIAEKVGLPVVVCANQLVQMSSSTDYRLSDEHKEFLATMIEELSEYKMFKGVTFRDEPSIGMAKTFGSVYDYLQTLKPDMFYFTSLLPIYCSDITRFSTENLDDKEEAYKDYIEAFSSETNAFVYDSYPLFADPVQGLTSLEDTWYQNLRLVAESAKANGYDAGITIQSCAFGNVGQETSFHKRAVTSKADVTYQLYTSLAYGMKHFSYFTYWEHWSEGDTEDFYTAMVEYPEKNGQEPIKTDAYYAVKEANEEIKKFDHVFLSFDWEGTMALTKENKVLSSALQMAGDYQSPRVSAVTATDDTIIGSMKDADGYDGYWIVNATDPGQNLSDSVTITFREASSAIAYVNGEEQTITLQDGTYTFDLGSGEAVFVIPYNE